MKLTKPGATPAVRNMRDEFDQLFDRFFQPSYFVPATRPAEIMWTPSLDFSETDKDFVVRIEAPGVKKEDLEVNLEGQRLTLSGHRTVEQEEKDEDYFWREREEGRFVRVVQLPSAVDAGKIDAKYGDGVMTVRLPKHESNGTKRIAVK